MDARFLSRRSNSSGSALAARSGDGVRDACLANDSSRACLLQADEGQMRKHAHAGIAFVLPNHSGK
jgi:hypothetical protein